MNNNDKPVIASHSDEKDTDLPVPTDTKSIRALHPTPREIEIPNIETDKNGYITTAIIPDNELAPALWSHNSVPVTPEMAVEFDKKEVERRHAEKAAKKQPLPVINTDGLNRAHVSPLTRWE